jgi:hypothetical protein
MLTLPGKKDAPAVEHKAHITASWSAALPRDGRGSFLLAAGVSSARRRTGMQGSLGEKIGEGVFADVHAWAPGQVVKLSKPGIPQWVVQHETQMTRAVFAAGGPAPEVLGEVTLDGRFGIVLPRFDGPTLTQATRTGAITREQAGAILATLCLAVHKTRLPPDALSLREAMDARLRFGGSVLPEHITTGVLALIEHLAPDDVLCHSDLHPGNVIMTAQGPRLIDWLGAARAPPPTRLHSAMSCLPSLARNTPTIRSGQRSIPFCRWSMRGWPA